MRQRIGLLLELTLPLDMCAHCEGRKDSWLTNLACRRAPSKETLTRLRFPCWETSRESRMHVSTYCTACQPVTSSKIPIKLWYRRLLRVHRGYGRTRGPAICDKDHGFQLGSRVLNFKFWEALSRIWEKTPSLFLSNIKGVDGFELYFNVYRSFRLGSDSQAIEQGLDKSVVDTVNRWKVVVEKAGGSKPSHGSMSQYYADTCMTLAKYKLHVSLTAFLRVLVPAFS
jgi:hypothetical protein